MFERFEEITNEILKIEKDHDVEVLYACESGSRAWGFASSDSDFDVRFIYVHRQDWYLSVDLEKKRDVIEIPIDDLLDISGWDLRKALGLLRKSNPPLMEWLGSPIVYQEKINTGGELKSLLLHYFSPISCGYHYLSQAKKTYNTHLEKDRVNLKKYFYSLRPLLAVQWIEQGRGVVPTEFGVLVKHLIRDNTLLQTIEELIAVKKIGLEKDTQNPIPILNDFIESELKRFEATKFALPDSQNDPEILNMYFRKALNNVWAEKG